MKWLVIGIAAVGLLICGLTWAAERGADNDNAAALLSMFYLPGFGLLALDVLLALGWLAYVVLF